MTALISTLLAAALYLGGTLYQVRCLQQRQTASPSILRGIGAVALIAHAFGLYTEMFTGQGLSFG
ncbi:MAG: inner membrane protein YpjD, partial [Pseudomonas sp.]